MEGCHLRGAISLGEHSIFNMGAKIYGSTTIGPHCKIGGEVNNLIVFGYSNKAHDGFLGNSVIGVLCKTKQLPSSITFGNLSKVLPEK